MIDLTLWRYASPIGQLGLATDAGGVVHAFSFDGTDDDVARVARRHWTDAQTREGPAPRAVVDSLDAYFTGRRDALADIPWRIAGDGFQEKVWAELTRVSVGATISYGEMARRIGEPGAAQAVGVALNRNPIALILPCHRVVGADGALVGFGGGVERKRWLLAHEGALLL